MKSGVKSTLDGVITSRKAPRTTHFCHFFPQTGLSCRGPGGELEAGRGYTGRRTILHARFVCVFTVFERSRFTTLQRNGGYPHVCMCFISQNGPGAFQTSSGSISPANLKNDPKNIFSQNCPGTFGVSFAIITGT